MAHVQGFGHVREPFIVGKGRFITNFKANKLDLYTEAAANTKAPLMFKKTTYGGAMHVTDPDLHDLSFFWREYDRLEKLKPTPPIAPPCKTPEPTHAEAIANIYRREAESNQLIIGILWALVAVVALLIIF